MHSSENLTSDQYTLVIVDVFTGEMYSEMLNLLWYKNILLADVPPNMTKFYQLLGMTADGFSKCFIAWKPSNWYTWQVSALLDKGFSIDETDIKLHLSLMKPLHAGWLVDF